MDVRDLAGLCAKCLVQGAFDSAVGANEADAGGVGGTHAAADDGDFGRYHIVRPLGEGGMGTVYLAEQRDPIRREVALKVVKLGMDTSQVLARFANERQALAMMDHPNVARIFDAGATPKGRPYFVMEYIPGETITDYCDGKRLTIRERLELFLAVCRAVQHAHQKGVIHRDLKPSNVLVTEHEGAPVPKVIDFGIAKATDQWAIEKTLLTQFGQMVGTPEYASPEQAEVVAGDVDERSDVYALGVLVYELLIGTAPFDAARLRQAGLSEMLRIIREEEAPPLSQRLAAVGAARAEIAARRNTDPASLHRLVVGDLTWIAMKALDKVRERRYASAADLAVDIRRYLEHRPVLASPPSRVYLARKFLRRNRPLAFGTAAALAVIALAGVTMWSLARRDVPPRPALTDKDTIVLAEFTNTTGDPVFDDTLRRGLAVQLQQSPFLSVVSDEGIRRTLSLMNQPADARLTPDIAQGVCARTASAAVLEGSIAALGSQYVLGLRAKNCTTGDILADEQAQAARKEEVLSTLSQIATRFRTRVGESLATIEKHSTPLKQATTPSLEALKAFSAGENLITFDWGRRLPHLQRAVALDPEFAMAHAALGFGLSSLGESTLGRQSLLKAYQLRQRASDAERFNIETLYDRDYTGNLERERRTLETWAETYPREARAHSLLAGLALSSTGQHELAIAETDKALALEELTPTYISKARNQLHLNRLDDALLTVRQATERKLDSPDFLLIQYSVAFLKGTDDERERIVTLARKSPSASDLISHVEVLALARSGRLQDARRMSAVPVEIAQRAGQGERAGLFEAGRAVWEGFYGNAATARQSAGKALELGRGRDVDYAAAFALALSGDLPQSRALAEGLAREFPEATFVQFMYLPTLRALFALNARDPAAAIQALQIASRYDLALGGVGFIGRFGGLYPIYVRGLAYLAAGQPAEAAAEFQRIVDHRSIVLVDPVDAMARLQLARALALSGNTGKAKRAYDDLLTLWRDADPDLPILRSAKAEYDRLR
ncbi:MAG TPA: protein kinase [Vicinamibacterales bacterium]|nr:protein kinase [Vicinamibacterales bacterium]